MKAVTVCVNYDDYLSVTLPHNKSFFDEIIVVTDSKDSATQRLCREHNVRAVITDRFYENKDVFNKGKAINEALSLFTKKDWVCHIDADVVLPENFKEELGKFELKKDTIYGCPRLMCPDPAAWARYLIDNEVSVGWDKYKASFFIVRKTVKIRHFVPLGYLQLFHMSASCLLLPPWYPEDSPNAAESDVCFSLKWKKHHCFDGIHAIHLPVIGSQAEGVNWNSRKSPRFQ